VSVFGWWSDIFAENLDQSIGIKAPKALLIPLGLSNKEWAHGLPLAINCCVNTNLSTESLFIPHVPLSPVVEGGEVGLASSTSSCHLNGNRAIDLGSEFGSIGRTVYKPFWERDKSWGFYKILYV
jgi:hypothetical protein